MSPKVEGQQPSRNPDSMKINASPVRGSAVLPKRAMDNLDTTDLFLRARSAIVEAHRLSSTLQQVTQPITYDESHLAIDSSGPSSVEGHATQPTWTTTTSVEEASGVPAADPPHESAQCTVRKLVTVAQRLSHLRDEHESTLCHLMELRLQQVQLRRQQLSALHGLLSQQFLRLGAPVEAPLARTRAAIASALSLLVECSSDLEQLATLVGSDGETRRASLVQTVDAADQRADKVSTLARRLLEILASQAAAESTHTPDSGLTQDRLNSIPWYQCTESALENLSSSECPICLHGFSVGVKLSSLPCGHVHHHACLSEWLRICATCPMCKAPYPDIDYTLSQTGEVVQQGNVGSAENTAAAESPP